MGNTVAIIGGGISGTSMARLLSETHEVTLFERREKLGGLVSCDQVNGSLFHKVGGHVFNTKNEEVSEWFWSFFDKQKEFIKAKRNAKIYFQGKYIGYPLENHLYQLPRETVKQVIDDLLMVACDNGTKKIDNFDDFLKSNFGNRLYELYFKPYNAKIWNRDLELIPLEWLDGKLPMPDVSDIITSNFFRKEESEMVHSTFFYPKKGGSQFIIDRLSKSLNTRISEPIFQIEKIEGKFLLNEQYEFDSVIYTGDIRSLDEIFQHDSSNLADAFSSVKSLASNGTSNVFCETDKTDISWLYLPGVEYKAHRIIYTGNFSETNNRNGAERKTCVVEFSGIHQEEEMRRQLEHLPGNLKPLAFNFEKNSYIIHDSSTRRKIQAVKKCIEPLGMYLLGRFAEWEYYNMDKCIESAMELKKTKFSN